MCIKKELNKKVYIRAAIFIGISLSITIFIYIIYPVNTTVLCISKGWKTVTWLEELGSVQDIGYNPRNDGIIIKRYTDSSYVYNFSSEEWEWEHETRYLVRLYRLVGDKVVKTGGNNTPLYGNIIAKKEQRVKKTLLFFITFDHEERKYNAEVYNKIEPGQVYKAKKNFFYKYYGVTGELANSELVNDYSF